MNRKVYTRLFSVVLLICLCFTQLTPAATANSYEAIKVNPDMQHQTIEGWGTSLAWWGNVVGGWENTQKRDEIVELLFNPETGLGFNIVRYNIGGGENPSHTHMGKRVGSDVPGYKATENSEYDWEADINQIIVMQKAKEHGADIFDAFSNSAPYWMTYNNCASGNHNGSNNLKNDYYGAFAEYLVDIVDYFREVEGITFQTVIPVNEPSGIWWVGQSLLGIGGNNQEGMHFDIPNQKQITQETYAELQRRGLLDYTRISGAEEYTLDETYSTLTQYGETLALLDRINTHAYGKPGDRSKTDLLSNFAEQNQKKIWISEVGFDGSGDRYNIDSGMNLAKGVLKDLNELNSTAWVYWQAVEDAAPSHNWGLIDATFTGENEYYVGKQYYAMANYSKFIRPGYKIIDIDDEMSVAAYDPINNELVIVTANDTSSSKSYNYDLSGFDTVGDLSQIYRTSASENLEAVYSGFLLEGTTLTLDNIPQKSITTIVIPNAVYNGDVIDFIQSDECGNGINQFEYSDGWANDESSYYTDTPGEYLNIRFSGQDIQLYGTKGVMMGMAAVSIDGGPESNIDLYSPLSQENALIYSSPILTTGEHILSLRITGAKHAHSSGTLVSCQQASVNSGGINLLLNGDFESGNLENWSAVWNPGLAGVETNYPKTGQYNAFLHPTVTKDVGIEQVIIAPETKTYSFTSYVSASKKGVRLGVDVDGVQVSSEHVASSGGYRLYSLDFNAEEGQEIKLWFYSEKGIGWATIDDVILR